MASIAPSATMTSNQSSNQNYNFALTVLTSLFFMWGFITCLNDILVPHLKAVFTLNYTQASLIQVSFFIAYFVVSLPAGALLKKTGYKAGIIIGLVITGLGCLAFFPAAMFLSYPLFLTALFILAGGITILQVAANPYVAILGRPETASSRLNLTQSFNSLGTTLAPWFGSLLILSAAAKTTEEIAAMPPADFEAWRLMEAASVQGPYLLLASVLFLIALAFVFIKLPVIEPSEQPSSAGEGGHYDHAFSSAWGYKHLVLGAVAIFVYVGGEVSIGSYLVNFLSQPDIAGITEQEAGKYVSMYWGGAMIGRFLGSMLLSDVKNQTTRALYIAAVLVGAIILAYLNTGNWTDSATWLVFVGVNLIGFWLGKGKPAFTLGVMASIVSALLLVTILSTGSVAMWSILAIGLFNSIMFPTIFTLAIDGLGKHTAQGSGILCMAIVGGAVVPFVQGLFADAITLHYAFFIPLLCYLYIIFYGFKGYKIDVVVNGKS